MKTIILIPTYNELNNIQKLLPVILKMYPEMDILIIDDNSPDGTADFVSELSINNSNVKLIKREGKLGLGTAYVEGFRYMLKNGYDVAIQMDADYSHDPKEIANFMKYLDEYDLIIGSRYVQGVNVINWPMRRLLLSYLANQYTKIITGLPIKDSTGGFKCFKRKVLEAIDLNEMKSNGYSFQIEMTYKAWIKGFKLKEVSIVFTDRVAGTSKMSKKIVREAIIRVWKLRIRHMLGILK